MEFLFSSFNVTSLNVRGIRDNTKRKAVFLFCKRSEADLILLQETHSTDSDSKFWKSQWGNVCHFSHGTNNSSGVLILQHKFKGDVLESVPSNSGRWIILVVKHENATFIVCNIYGFNSQASNKILFYEVISKLKELQCKYSDSYTILCGDFNECPDDSVDRFPPKLSQTSQCTNLISSFCSSLSLTDAWRFFNPYSQDFTWSNNRLTFRSRIDLFLISSSILQFVKDVNHLCAPLSDHKQINLKLSASQETVGLRGYWKFNNLLLKDSQFNNAIKQLVNNILNDGVNNNYCKKWEYFKYKVRSSAIKRSKELKQENQKREKALNEKLNTLLSKGLVNQDDRIELKNIQLQLDQFYLNLAKGAFIRSRAKWLEEGEKNTNDFFALEKRNIKRKSLSVVNINDTLCKDPKLISDFVTDFYKNLYNSNFNPKDCTSFLENIHINIPPIPQNFKSSCESDLSIIELQNALFSMKKGK